MCNLESSFIRHSNYMLHFDFYRTAFLTGVAGLLACASAHAQLASADGSAHFATSSPAASEAPAVSSSLLRLSQPPAPETLASYYDGSHKDLHQSLAWMQEANAVTPTYWNLYTEARIRLQLQDYTNAQAMAEQAYQLALKSLPASQAYVQLSAAVAARALGLAKR